MGMKERRAYLEELVKKAGVITKEAQEITHKKLDAAQPAIGDQMQKEIESGTAGNYASDKSVDAELKGTVEVAENKIEGDDDKKAEKVLSETGTSVDKIHPCGAPAGTPADVVKSAALRTRIEAAVKAEMAKEAALKQAQEEAAKQEEAKKAELEKQASAKEETSEEITTATEVMNKIANLNEVKTQDEFVKLASDIQVKFEDLQRTNPLFNVAVEHKLMEKMAAEIDALAAENGMTPEDAAAALDEATANDPEAAAEMQSEAEGEALSDLAGAEQEQAAFMDGLDQTAAQVSEMLGQEVTGDDIAQAVSDVVEAAEQMGVEPEVLLEAAAQEMMGGAGGEPSEDDMAQAQQILDAAAAQGISPEEVIQAVASEMEGGEAAPAEAAPAEAPAETPAEEKPAEEPAKEEKPAEDDMEKEASLKRQEVLKKLASTKRGANLLKVLNRKA